MYTFVRSFVPYFVLGCGLGAIWLSEATAIGLLLTLCGFWLFVQNAFEDFVTDQLINAINRQKIQDAIKQKLDELDGESK